MRKIFLLALAAIAGCSSNGADNRIIQMPSGSTAVETVNGTPVPASLLDAVAEAHRLDVNQPKQRDQALTLVTDLVLLAQAAQRENFAADPRYLARVEAARLQGVADAALAQFQQRTPINDTMLKAEYDNQVARAGKVAYDFSQLLFDNEEDALRAEDDIVSGQPFDKVFDAWRSKAKQARRFTRVLPDQLPPELAKALADLRNGDSTKVPVKTEYGWHVVHLDIANPYAPPPFDQVKEGIRRNLQMKIGRERLDKLREQAQITYPAGTAPPAGKPVEQEKPAEKND
ncbi:MAG: peptidyl-prolyl cis-trans isomerase [Xanthomonadaceae bacterium]|nr:peptidyl-prolyl cis-trans isomerase [Xanthomonadaceae bacterium]MDE2083685.1 peptidyl-prolyl cis-trans isomerase [Xanthomonadaceae bacterium]